ncbi:MAG: 3-phosphoshikimate 1-carboxyvinyltransferase [Dehalococcoidales bacterium]|jgi:3-phosphoshikimate 1-carboxyvinyltransferase|nr:3-phosphoshikimate 1-carboxyvinyltransferase [Dehalococcoidales bacterium]
MRVKISKSELRGKVAVPPSKSYTIRSLMCAALAKGKSRIINPLISDDTEAASQALETVGIKIQKNDGCWEVQGGRFHAPDGDIYCRDSAATMRFMACLSAIIPGKCRLVPSPSLAKRPIEPLVAALNKLKVKCRMEDSVVVVDEGKFLGGNVSLTGDVSSQFISGLLFLCPLAEAGLNIRITTPPESGPYIEMTLGCMKEFGIDIIASPTLQFFTGDFRQYKPADYTVEADWSTASYLLAAGAIAGSTEATGLNLNSLQGDRVILNLLSKMGASIIAKKDMITTSRSNLKPIRADLTDSIDLLPTMAVVAALANGQSRFYGIRRARFKESNRVTAVKEGLEKMQIPVTENDDMLIINGGKPVGATIDSFGDHRIAMAFSLLGAAVGDTVIEGAECVNKTFPHFWETLESIGAKVD